MSMLLIIGSATYAQSLSTQTFSVVNSNLPTVGAIFNVPINISTSLTSARTIQVVLLYDITVLEYVDTANLQQSAHKVNVDKTVPGSIKFTYQNQSISPFTFNNGKLFDVRFKYLAGNTNLTFSTSPLRTNGCFIYTGSFIFFTNFTNGSIQGNGYFANTINGGSWANAASWSSGIVPNNWHNVTVGAISEVSISTNSIAHDVTINNGGALTVNAGKTLTVAGSFTIQNGGSFINNGSGVNTAAVERTIAKDNAWHFLASPVDGAPIKPYFAPTAVDNTFDFYKWDETKDMYFDLPWINIRTSSFSYASGFDNFEIGRGYLVAYSNSYTGSATHSFVGTLGNGDKMVTISNSLNHFNLIGNPYPSAIDWDATAWGGDRSALLGPVAAVRVWNENTGNYGVYSGGIGLNGMSNVIARDQSFFVEAISAGSLTIPNAARVHGTQAFLKSTVADIVKLNVSTTANSYSDEMIVKFDANANASEGIAKWPSLLATAPSIYSVKNNENLTINTLTSVSSNLVVPVGFKAGVNGSYTIKASNLNSFTTPTYVYLKDINTNIITDLNQKMYTFAASTNDNANRFELIFALSPLGISNNVIENTSIYSYENTIYINSNETISQIAIYNTLGQLIKTFENKSGSISVNMDGNPTAYYIVRVVTSKNVYSEKVLVK